MIMIKNRTTVLEVFQFIVYFMYIIYHQIYTRVSKTNTINMLRNIIEYLLGTPV